MKGMIIIKDELLKILENIHEAKSLIEINDLLNLKTVDELKELQAVLKELVDEYVVYNTKSDKYILFKNYIQYFKQINFKIKEIYGKI